MRFKTSVSLMVAVVLGLVTAKVGLDILKKQGGRNAVGTKIVVAVRDMDPGSVLTEEDVALAEVPANLVPEKAIRDPKHAIGRTVLATSARNYPLLDSQLSAPGSGSGMQAMIPRGMRAVNVEVGDAGSVGGLIIPGCSVDVISTMRKGESTVARTVVENVKVQFVHRGRPTGGSSRSSSLSSGSGSSARSTTPEGPVKSVTLLVSMKQAMSIELAQASGKPRLVLRGNSDTSSAGDVSVSQNELLGLPDEPPPIVAPTPEPVAVEPPPSLPDRVFDNVEPEPAVNKRPVQIIRGGSEQTIYYDEDGAAPSEQDAKGNGKGPGGVNGGGNGAAPAAASAKTPPTTRRSSAAAADEATSGAVTGATGEAVVPAPQRDGGRGNYAR